METRKLFHTGYQNALRKTVFREVAHHRKVIHSWTARHVPVLRFRPVCAFVVSSPLYATVQPSRKLSSSSSLAFRSPVFKAFPPAAHPSPAKTSTGRRSLAIFSLGVLCGAAVSWLATRQLPAGWAPTQNFLLGSHAKTLPGDQEGGDEEGVTSERPLSAAQLAHAAAPNREEKATAGDAVVHYPSALLPSAERLLLSTGFASLVSTAHRQPLYVAERLGAALASDDGQALQKGDRGPATDAGDETGEEERHSEADGETDADADGEPETRIEEAAYGTGRRGCSSDDSGSHECSSLGRRRSKAILRRKGERATGGVDRKALLFRQDPRVDKLWSPDRTDYIHSGTKSTQEVGR
nr:hypothetical protein TgIb.1060c [Toxoplasma gondii RH]